MILPQQMFADIAPNFPGITPTPPPANSSPGASSNRDTAQKRLEALQKVLQSYLWITSRATPPTQQAPFVDKAVANVSQAMADTTQGIEYVKAHPGSQCFAR